MIHPHHHLNAYQPEVSGLWVEPSMSEEDPCVGKAQNGTQNCCECSQKKKKGQKPPPVL